MTALCSVSCCCSFALFYILFVNDVGFDHFLRVYEPNNPENNVQQPIWETLLGQVCVDIADVM